MATLFADTYALVAYADGSPAFVRLMKDSDVRTTGLNVAEFAYILLKRGSPTASEAVQLALQRVIEPSPTVPFEAASFKFQRLRAGGKCSFVDAWGYATAQSLNLPFFTGDEGFRGVPGVKFVKA